MPLPVQFDIDRLSQPAVLHPVPGYDRPGVQSLVFENEPFHGNPTHVFGWLGMPYLKEGETCPAMVLIHGGGGTAFDEWVRLWTARGYAAIAIDTCGCKPELPVAQHAGGHAKTNFPGPEGWCTSFKQMGEARRDQWPYHAVTALIRAHTILASQPGVDPARIGVTGISWGGYLTALVMGIDPRYAAAIPVYGCGFITENSTWRDNEYDGISNGEAADWAAHWDPKHYLPNATVPSLWVSGTNDFAYPMDSLRKSLQAVAGPAAVALRREMPHGHEAGWNPAEIHSFTDAHFRGTAPLPRILSCGIQDGRLVATVETPRPLAGAEILFSRATGMWQDRRFNPLPATVDGNTVSAEIPPNTTVAFLNVWDDRDLIASTPHIQP